MELVRRRQGGVHRHERALLWTRLPRRPVTPGRRRVRRAAAAAIALAGGVTFSFLPSASGDAPGASPAHAEFALNGSTVGSGTVVLYAGQAYERLGAVKLLSGSNLAWDAATATSSRGSAADGASTYLEDLSGQPYYKSSGALCWQYSKDTTAGVVESSRASLLQSALNPCKPVLPASPSMTNQHYARALTVLVSASNAKSVSSDNSVTLNYDLLGHYLELTGTLGLVDTPFNRLPMQVRFTGNGRVLSTVVLTPGSLPRSFKVIVTHVSELSVVVSNISGAAPRWDDETPNQLQYSPGAVLIANPRLSA